SAILPLVHAVIFHVTESFLSFSDLAFAEDGLSFMSLAYLGIPWQMYVFTVLWVFLGVIAILLAPKKQSYHPVMLLLCLVVSATGVCGIAAEDRAYDLSAWKKRFTWLDTYDPTSIAALYTDFTNANECLLFCGNAQYAVRSLTTDLTARLGREHIVRELDEYYAANPRPLTNNEMTGYFRGKNVICILGESIDTWMLNESFMPNLYSLQKESIDFTDHWTPLFLSAGTFNTEFALNCSFYLPVSGTSARTYATNEYPQSLAHVFRANGYTANSYHQLDGRFYNREVVHLKWGYESFNDHDQLMFVGDQTCDTSLMEPQSYRQIVHDEPFMSYVITYSGHGPYNETRQVIAEPHLARAEEAARASGVTTDNPDTWSQYVHAIAHAMECDAMIGKLIENMTADGHINDTVILFFGDHYSKYLTDVEFVMDLKGATDANTLYHTPFFIYSKGMEYTPVEKVTASADMMPTLFNLMGFAYDPTYIAGSDAFSEYGGFVAFKDYSWYDGNIYWTPDYQGEETEYIREMNARVRAFLNASWNTVKTNYFGGDSEAS
ncbi:MAG: LTA synthase family protein, partial [Clostridia bacterium]|nr:LTA synthase family protein [Clostridia bacterium]